MLYHEHSALPNEFKHHQCTTVNDMGVDSLLVLASARDIVDKMNIRKIVKESTLNKHQRMKI